MNWYKNLEEMLKALNEDRNSDPRGTFIYPDEISITKNNDGSYNMATYWHNDTVISRAKNITNKQKRGLKQDMKLFWDDDQPCSKNLEKEYPENNQQPTAEMFREAISKDHKKGKGENNMGFFCGGDNIRSKNLVEEYPEITKPVYKVPKKPVDSRYVKASDFVERLSEELSEYKKENGCVAQIKELIDGCGGNFDTKDLIEFIISPDENKQSGVGYKPEVYKKIAEVAEEYGFEDIRIYEGSSNKNFVAIRQYD